MKNVNEVISLIKDAGCSGSYDPRFSRHLLKDIPSWKVFSLAYEWRRELCAISYTKHLFNQPNVIKFEENKDSKCAYCRKLGLDGCPYGKGHNMPAATFKKGCELWSENKSVYF